MPIGASAPITVKTIKETTSFLSARQAMPKVFLIFSKSLWGCLSLLIIFNYSIKNTLADEILSGYFYLMSKILLLLFVPLIKRNFDGENPSSKASALVTALFAKFCSAFSFTLISKLFSDFLTTDHFLELGKTLNIIKITLSGNVIILSTSRVDRAYSTKPASQFWKF